MKTFLHYLHRYPLATMLNILGIALTVAVLYVLGVHIDYNRSYNKCIPEYETLYRIDCTTDNGNNWQVSLPRPIMDYLEKCPQIEGATLLGSPQEQVLDKDGSEVRVNMVRDEGKTLTLFGARRVDGVLEVKPGEGTVVIPASLARILFGEVHVAGRQLKWLNGDTSTVAGVYEDFPGNCTLHNCIYMHMEGENEGAFNNFTYSVYFRSHMDRKELGKVLDDVMLAMWADRMGGMENLSEDLRKGLASRQNVAMPIADVYFSKHDSVEDKGSLSALYMQEFAALLLLVICIINFANFSIGQAPMRIRSVLTRMVLGESLVSLRLSLLGEAVMVGVLAYIVDMAMVWLLTDSSYVAGLFTIDIHMENHLMLLALLLAVSVAIGLFSAAYSTRYITSFPPVCVMKGNIALTPQGQRMRTWLVGLQICVSLVMVIFIGTIYSQSHYIFSSDYGFAKDSILVDRFGYMQQYTCSKATMRQELESLPCVQSVSYSGYAIGCADNCMGWGRGNGEVSYNFRVVPVDWKYLRTYGIDVVEGRDFKEGDGDVYIINEAMKSIYPDIEVGKPLYDGELTVVGVCRNVRAFSTRVPNDQIPLVFVVFGETYRDWGDGCNNICIRLAPGVNIPDARRQVQETMAKHAQGVQPDPVFLDKLMEETYRQEFAFIGLMKICSALTLVITLIGVFCLTMFETEYRRKEIAVRKVMGSSVRQVLLLFTGRYSLPLLVAFVVAAPLGWYISAEWLTGFAEHAPIHWWLFPLALVVVGLVVLGTVVVQSWRVATMNPFYGSVDI